MTMDQETKQVEAEQKQAEDVEAQAEQLAEVSQEKEAEVSGEKETEVSADAEPDFESKFQEKWGTEYDNLQKTVIQPLATERDTYKKQVTELQDKLRVREDDADLKLIYELDDEEKGEDYATKRKEALNRTLGRVREFDDKKVEVEKNWDYLSKIREIEKKLETSNVLEITDALGGVQRYQDAVKDVIEVFTNHITEPMKKAIDRLNTATTPEHYKDILETIKSEAKGTGKRSKPDSGKSSGGGGKDYKKMSAKELIAAGLEEQENS